MASPMRKSNQQCRSRRGSKRHVAQLQQGPTKFGVKSAIWIAASASSRVASGLLATTESANNILNSINKNPFLGICATRSEEHTSELQSLRHLVCRLLLEKKKKKIK